MKPIYLIPFLAFALSSQAQEQKKTEKTEDKPESGIAPSYNRVGDTEDTEYTDTTLFNTTGLQVQPEFPGGIKAFYEFILANFNANPIPDGPKTVKGYVSFVIEKDGSVTSIKVLRDPGYGIGKEAIRVLKLSPKWKPGRQNEKPVRTSYNLPLTLNLYKEEPRKKN